jgi:hypothetical protein
MVFKLSDHDMTDIVVKVLVVKFCGGEVFGEISDEVSGEVSGEVVFALLVKFQVTNLVEKQR